MKLWFSTNQNARCSRDAVLPSEEQDKHSATTAKSVPRHSVWGHDLSEMKFVLALTQTHSIISESLVPLPNLLHGTIYYHYYQITKLHNNFPKLTGNA